jgi:HSP20 family protein
MSDDFFSLPLSTGDLGSPATSMNFEEIGLETEGQLAVDVADDGDELVITAIMAGANPQDISLHLHHDLLTIRGQRHPEVTAGKYYLRECYWGKFSRSIVLPCEVKPELAQANYRFGVLTIKLLKTEPDNTISITVVDE